MKILCFGDSNTYGYDPRSFLDDRYPADVRWTDVLARDTGWTVLNMGQNGREIPCRPAEIIRITKAISREMPDILVVMLGSNDLLCHSDFGAEQTAARMETFLRTLPPVRILLVSPPPMQRGTWVCEERLLTESARLAAQYAALACKLGIFFADAGQWGVELTFDGVHFSEAGHHAFANGIRQKLEGNLFPSSWQ